MRSSSRSTSLEKVLVPVPARSKYSHAMLAAVDVELPVLQVHYFFFLMYSVFSNVGDP
jgi:hypothetical protein